MIQSCQYFLLTPEQAHMSLHPLEIADRYTGRIGQDIGQYVNAALFQNVVGIRRRGSVSTFNHNFAPEAASVLGDDLISHCAWCHYITLKLQKFFVADRRSIGKMLHIASLTYVFGKRV